VHESETTFEQTLGTATEAAEAAIRSAADVRKAATKARKAALNGDISALGRCPEDLASTLGNLRQSVAALELAIEFATEWPGVAEDGQPSFGERYSAELRDAADADGLGIHEKDGALISYPTVVRVGNDRSLMIDQKKIRTLRPSHVLGLLRDAQASLGRYKPERFIEALYFVYEDILKDQKKTAFGHRSIPPMPLSRIYKHLTSLPGVSREYTKMDFARDLYILDAKGPERAKRGKGPKISFPSSTGTREKGYFSFVGPDGFESKYYSVHFAEDS